jgi:magnesium-transporting ATPase (P-type)
VNDGPALQAADIGIAMGKSGTDVARAAADLVLLDDDFSTIIAAVEQGRATYANIRRFLTYHLTDNVAELTPFVVWALSGGRFPLALGVLQILCLDIGTDLLPALALGNEAPSPGILQRPPEARHLIDRSLVVRAFGVLGLTEAVIEMSAFVVALVASGWRPGDRFPTGHALMAASGAAFAAVVIGQIANSFACRSATTSPWRLGWGTNRLLLWAVGVEIVVLAGFLLVPPVARVLGHAFPPLAGLAVAVLAAPLVLLADEVHKQARAGRHQPGRNHGDRRARQHIVASLVVVNVDLAHGKSTIEQSPSERHSEDFGPYRWVGASTQA